jgi:hypothetical protein
MSHPTIRAFRRSCIPLLSAFGLGIAAACAQSATSLARAAHDLTTSIATPLSVTAPTARSPLKIEHVRFEPGPLTETAPSTTVKLDMVNESAHGLTDLVVRLWIEEAVPPNSSIVPRRTLAGPYTLRGKVVLEPGHTINYEMLLRNLSPDCACVVKVDVLSVRSLPTARSAAR